MGAVLGANPGAGVLMPAAAFLFFVISGFVIYRPFVAAHLAGNPRPDIGRFYRSRLLRVLPLWALAVTAYLVVNGAGSLHGPGQWVLTYLLLQYPVAAIRFAVVGPAWALSVEWLFYLSAPLIALAMFHARRRFAPRTAPVRAEATVLAAFFVVAWLVPAARPAVAIVIGMAFAVFDVHRRVTRHTPRWLRLVTSNGWAIALVTAAVWLVLGNYHYRPGLSVQWVQQDPAVLALWVGMATVWFVAAAFGRPDRSPQRQLGSPLAVRLSQLTFGLYLWHSLVLDQVLDHLGRAGNFEAIFYLTAIVSVLLATATYFLIERPSMQLIRRGSTAARAATVSTAGAISTAGAGSTTGSASAAGDAPRTVVARVDR
ncbi:MAG TPA: acyltransferase, partial [Acidimicrobiales bacterium]